MKIAFVTVLAIALLPCYANASLTNDSVPEWKQLSSQGIAPLPQPPNPGTPGGQRTPGGTRGDCKQTDKQTDKLLTALVPENAEGLTTAEYPIFWFYIPDAPEGINSIEFSLHDGGDDTTLYRTSLQLTKTPGVIAIPLPPSPEHSLKLNESYRWRLIINCDHKEMSEDLLELDGLVKRVQGSPNQVIWYDELTNLAQRYLANPQNPQVKQAWAKLMQSVGLEGLAQEPMVTSVGNSENN